MIECYICGKESPLINVLMNEGLHALCQECCEWMLAKEGEIDVGIRQTN